MNNFFSWARLTAIIIKEFIQMKRDRMTFAMIIAIPLMQIVLFGYAINSNPKDLPTAVLSADHSIFTRSYIQGLKNTGYFHFVKTPKNEAQAEHWLATGKILFILNIPPNFTNQLVKGKKPELLLTADATDPTAIGNALSAAEQLTNQVFNKDLVGPLQPLRSKPGPVQLVIHQKYNPEIITHYNIVPGLIGVVLTMTMIVITALAITRERERNTMENLLATPAKPLEVMIGKIIPYIIVGYIQISLILAFAFFLFDIPFSGNLLTLYLCALPFIAANLSVGITFSTIAKNQLQSMQMAFFFFLPSILLSGFMFPFYGMPLWAQWLGQVLPLTHFIRIVRGVMLKGNGWAEVLPQVWPILLFMVAVILIGMKRYKQTLD